MIKHFFFCFTLFFAFAGLHADGLVSSLLLKIEDNLVLDSDLTAKIELTQQKVIQGTRKIQSVYYRQDKSDAFLLVNTAPESEKGNGYLRQGKNFWLYRRNTRTFQHVHRNESISGTDADVDDFEKVKLSEQYDPVVDANGEDVFEETTLGEVEVYQFDLIAKNTEAKYPKKRFWVRKDNALPLKVQSLSLSDGLIETTYYLKYTKIGEKFFVTKSLFLDEFEPGNKTLLVVKNISFAPIEDLIFTKAYLENLSK